MKNKAFARGYGLEAGGQSGKRIFRVIFQDSPDAMRLVGEVGTWFPDAMEPFATHRTILDPGNVRGLPGVTKHTPIPARETPLEGTKTMLCPKDEHLKDLVTGRTIEVILPSRTADILGILAMVFAVGVIGVCWFGQRFVGSVSSQAATALAILGLALFHLLVIFSQILSSGRNKLGGLAILVLYAGGILSVIIDHVLA